MDEGFKKKIKEDIVKAGFYSEMQVIRCFLSHGWHCVGGYNYFDQDEDKTREIDVFAAYPLEYNELEWPLVFGVYYIYAEVKKSEKPWVVFKQTEGGFQWGAPGTLIAFDKLPCEEKELEDILWQYNLGSVLGWRGYGIHEAFKPPNQTSRWHSAFIAVSKCAYEAWKFEEEVLKKLREEALNVAKETGLESKSLRFRLAQPVVILDGTLIAIELDSKGAMHISEIEFAPFHFYFKTKNYPEYRYFVDVVTVGHLESYIKFSEEWFHRLGSDLGGAYGRIHPKV